MAQLDSEETVREPDMQADGISPLFPAETKPADVMTGGSDPSRYLYSQLKFGMKHALAIDMIVSFLMESGVKMICSDLKAALDRGAQVRILTGNYLGITQPSALYYVRKELGNRADLRFYNDRSRSFHAKAYIFHYRDRDDLFIGSSNLSRSALTSGIEWNYRLDSTVDPESFRKFTQEFEDLFFHHSIVIDDAELRRYSKSWHRPALSRDLERYDEEYGELEPAQLIQPRGAQIEALCALENSRAEGAEKALVQAATGVGKTYLAAFDSAGYQKVLFVAHREEILMQAARTFKNVRGTDDYGFFNGKQKDTDRSVIFASVATLGRLEYLTPDYFAEDYFDYIVIDEFHHAVNHQYRNIVRYFKPSFLLGLTATPDRMDGRDIYEICDYNVPYEISLKEAINKGLLVPFHYYGIYDETDYSGLHLVNGKYEEADLTRIYRGNGYRDELISQVYAKYHSRRALGFCCSRAHADQMARQFRDRGIPAVAVYSSGDGVVSADRNQAVRQLRNQEIRVIFCVDMFNEGLDIDCLDMVMFLRPTESPVVFLQQLGRGLRTCKGKKYLNVLDFIGNYEKAGSTRSLLRGEGVSRERTLPTSEDSEYPDDCIVDFDLRLINLFREMEKKSLPFRKQVRAEFYRVKELLGGKVPTRMELFTNMEDAVYITCMRRAKDNPFRKYLEYLHDLGELSEEEQEVYSSIGREFLSVIETTDMQKVYKMPVLYSFYHHGNIRMAVTEEEVLASWKEFFNAGTNWKDFSEGITYEEYQKMTDRQHFSKAKNMPIRFLKESGRGFFTDREGYALALRDELREVVQMDGFRHHMGDILEYRTMEYYRRRYRDQQE